MRGSLYSHTPGDGCVCDKILMFEFINVDPNSQHLSIPLQCDDDDMTRMMILIIIIIISFNIEHHNNDEILPFLYLLTCHILTFTHTLS